MSRKESLIAVGLGLVGVFVVKERLSRAPVPLALPLCVRRTQVRLARQLLTGYLSVAYTFHLQRNSAEIIRTTTETLQRFTTGFLVSLLIVLGEFLVVVALIRSADAYRAAGDAWGHGRPRRSRPHLSTGRCSIDSPFRGAWPSEASPR